jgi:hypothetical protein
MLGVTPISYGARMGRPQDPVITQLPHEDLRVVKRVGWSGAGRFISAAAARARDRLARVACFHGGDGHSSGSSFGN